MIKYFCDKCDLQITENIEDSEYTLNNSIKGNLCKTCTGEIKRIIEKNKKLNTKKTNKIIQFIYMIFTKKLVIRK